jgi:hypothetical protein
MQRMKDEPDNMVVLQFLEKRDFPDGSARYT